MIDQARYDLDLTFQAAASQFIDAQVRTLVRIFPGCELTSPLVAAVFSGTDAQARSICASPEFYDWAKHAQPAEIAELLRQRADKHPDLLWPENALELHVLAQNFARMSKR